MIYRHLHRQSRKQIIAENDTRSRMVVACCVLLWRIFCQCHQIVNNDLTSTVAATTKLGTPSRQEQGILWFSSVAATERPVTTQTSPRTKPHTTCLWLVEDSKSDYHALSFVGRLSLFASRRKCSRCNLLVACREENRNEDLTTARCTTWNERAALKHGLLLLKKNKRPFEVSFNFENESGLRWFRGDVKE